MKPRYYWCDFRRVWVLYQRSARAGIWPTVLKP